MAMKETVRVSPISEMIEKAKVPLSAAVKANYPGIRNVLSDMGTDLRFDIAPLISDENLDTYAFSRHRFRAGGPGPTRRVVPG